MTNETAPDRALGDQIEAAMAAPPDPDEGLGRFDPKDEPLPFLSNFQDIFLTLGVLIFLGGAAILSVMLAGGTNLVVTAGILVLNLAVVALLSQILVKARRRILPGIVLSTAFVGLAVAAVLTAYVGIVGERIIDDWSEFEVAFGQSMAIEDAATMSDVRAVANGVVHEAPLSSKALLLCVPLIGFLAALFYYRYYRLPFASALTGLGAISVVLVGLFLLIPFDLVRFSPLTQFLSGLVLLFAAIGFDMRDPARVTRFSGNGFWLHFFAAPLVLTGALTMVSVGPAYDFEAISAGGWSMDDRFSVAQSVITLIIIGVFALISLLLNRRALVVSGLVSAGVAIGVIVNATGIGGAGVAATTLMVLGAAILLLGIGWQGARRALLVLVPSTGVWARIFPRNDHDG